MAEETKTEVKVEKDNDAIRNAIFIVLSLLIIVFLIGLALLINRGVGAPPNNDPVESNEGLINSDTNIPTDSENNEETNSESDDTTASEDVTSEESQEEPTETAPEETEPETAEDEGSVLEGATTKSPSGVLPSGHTEVGYKRSLSNQTEISDANYWMPTNYIAGDIPANNGKYTVQYGDTLWWIAAGRYGDAFQWTKIKDANASQIGFLPNGQQALIFPGQVFDLP